MSDANEHFWKLVRNHYGDASIVGQYRDRVKQGLRLWEEEVLRRYHSPPGKILDIGCGCGREAVALSRLEYRVTAVDIAPEQLRVAETIASESGVSIDFHRSDGKTLDFPDRGFDYVTVWSQVFGNVPGPQNRQALLRECGRVLREGGRMSFSVHDRVLTEKLAAERGLIKSDDSSGLEEGDFVMAEEHDIYWHCFTRAEILDLCAGAELNVIDCQMATAFGDPVRENIWVCICEKKTGHLER